MHSTRRTIQLLLLLLFLVASPAFAGTGGTSLPWNTPLQNLVDNLTGTTGKALAILFVAVGGVVWAMGHSEAAVKKSGGIVIGIGLLLGAPSVISTLGFEGAVAIPHAPAAPGATAAPSAAESPAVSSSPAAPATPVLPAVPTSSAQPASPATPALLETSAAAPSIHR